MTKWGKTDFEHLKRLQKNLEQFNAIDRQTLCEELSKEIAARLLRMVVKRTPVGKMPEFGGITAKVEGTGGKIKSFLTSDGERKQKYWSGYRGGDLRRGWQIGPVAWSGCNCVIIVFNNVEYASFVEYGHRQQLGRYVPALGKRLKQGWVKGKFMLTISEKEIKNIAPKLIERRIKEKLEDVFSAE